MSSLQVRYLFKEIRGLLLTPSLVGHNEPYNTFQGIPFSSGKGWGHSSGQIKKSVIVVRISERIGGSFSKDSFNHKTDIGWRVVGSLRLINYRAWSESILVPIKAWGCVQDVVGG